MIIDKTPLPNDPTPADAPPSYETITRNEPTHHLDLKSASGLPATPLSGGSTSPAFDPSSSAIGNRTPTTPTTNPTSAAKGKGRAQWFNFTASKTSKDVKSTILGLVRDLVREDSHAPAALGILQSCAEACSSNNLTLSSILQEKSIEGHTPLYWAIVKRTPDEIQNDSTQIPDLLTALLSYSTPLSQDTMSDIRYGCLVTSDQPLFQRLRLSPDFSSGSAADEMLIGATLPPDDVHVENLADDEGSFAVDLDIIKFQKRMMITKSIQIEFIARGRMWRLSFFVAPDNCEEKTGRRPGSWCVSLSLMEHSPPAWIDSRLLIADPNVNTTTTKSPSGCKTSKPKPKPTISMRLKSMQPLTSPSTRGNNISEIVVAFEDSLMASSLQYSGSSYIAPDETLRARLEAKLGKPDNDCIIC